MNFEFSWNQKWWESQVNSGEIRPIIGFRFGPDSRWSFTFNPIVDNDYHGGIGGLEFNPATRLDYKIDDTWTAAVEEYDGFGQLRKFLPGGQQFHELWLDRRLQWRPDLGGIRRRRWAHLRQRRLHRQADVHERSDRPARIADREALGRPGVSSDLLMLSLSKHEGALLDFTASSFDGLRMRMYKSAHEKIKACGTSPARPPGPGGDAGMRPGRGRSRQSPSAARAGPRGHWRRPRN